MNRLFCILLVGLLNITAGFAATYDLSVAVVPVGGGSLNTSGGTYEEGSKINLRTSGNTGYVFRGWYEGDDLVSSSASFSYVMPQHDVSLVAMYEFDPSVPGNPAMPDTTTYYRLTASVSPHGAGSLNIYEGRYAYGANVSMRTSGNTGYRFIGWQNEEGTMVSNSSSFGYSMPRHDSELTALYEFDPGVPANPDSLATNYTVYVRCKPLGGGSFNNSAFNAPEGSNVRIYAYTNTGYRFVHWEAEDGSVIATDQNFYYVMPHGNSTIYGVFEFDPATPGNPNKNYWDKELGQLIIDDFATGSLNSAASSAITGSSSDDVTMIIVAGRMNSNDFGIANYYRNCTLLDLSRVSGVTEVPSYAFDGTALESVYLPATIERIGDRAFENCKQLASVTLYAMTPPALGNNVFRGIPEGLVVYVPAAAIAQYQEAAGWHDFVLLPIQEDIRNITVSLPEGYSPADFSGLWLELTNTKNGQRLHYVMTDRQQYTFPNIIRNTTWSIQLRNERGDVFGQINNVEVKDEDLSLIFDSLSRPQSVALSVLTPDGADVTAQTQVTWLDAEGAYMAQSASMSGLCAGMAMSYIIALPQDLATIYVTPEPMEYTVTEGANSVVCTLQAIPQVVLSGKVTDVSTRSPLSAAVISASQTFVGKYSRTVSTKTDAQGNYTLTVLDVPTRLSFSSADYISQTVECDSLMGGVSEVRIDDIALKPITGATVSVNFTYRPSVVEGETPEVQEWYSDYNNVTYSIYNETKRQPITKYNVQYPRIVLLEEVDEGDVLQLTATSVTSAFVPVAATATIDAEQHASATFGIVELGGIEASFKRTDNAAVVGSLYDSKGKLVKTYNYTNAALSVDGLADGAYTLMSMGASSFFNSVYDLAGLSQTGLVEGVDYVTNAVEVKSGLVSVVEIEEVPVFDESQFYYTGDNTSFTVNKPSIVAGNYLTLTARIDFKPAYASGVSNLNLIVDLPESCQFVENSVMVGNSTSSYALDGNRLTIPVARYTDRVRFCVIPTLGGDYAPSAFVDFALDGQTKTQPIGSAFFNVENLAINVPPVVAKETFAISGVALARSKIEIYDEETLIGETVAIANGSWSLDCTLANPYNMSIHSIYAKATAPNGMELQTDIKQLMFDANAIELSKVTMYHWNPEMNTNYEVVYDFLNPSSESPQYTYYIYNKQFTFTIEFTNNDPALVNDVVLFVKTGQDREFELETEYSPEKGLWIASGEFGNMYDGDIPVNVAVDYNVVYPAIVIDDSAAKADERAGMDQYADMMTEVIDESVEMEIVEDTDTDLVYNCTNGNGDSCLYGIKVLDYDNAIQLMDEKQFDFVRYEDGALCTYESDEGYRYVCTLIDTNEKIAFEFSVQFDTPLVAESPRMASKASAYKNMLKTLKTTMRNLKKGIKKQDGTVLSNIGGGILDMLGISKYTECPTFGLWCDFVCDVLDGFIQQNKIIVDAITAKCPDGSYKLTKSQREKFSDELLALEAKQDEFGKQCFDYLEQYRDRLIKSLAYDFTLGLLSKGVGKALGSVAQYGKVMKNKKNADYMWHLIKGGELNRKRAENGLEFVGGLLFQGFDQIVNPAFADFPEIMDKIQTYVPKRRSELSAEGCDLIKRIKAAYKKCKKKDPNVPPKRHYPLPPAKPKIDPSGYVYEAVFSNRVEGVTATAYYKEMVEDMYGDLHENVVKWDAEEYAQENPLFTDEFGYYRWDVPQGLWQVKFEKDGYETTYSDWLPVPPPQLDVNIPMKQNVQPNVKVAHAYEDAVELEFDKYMLPELLNADNIIVQADGQTIAGSVQLLNEEVSYEGLSETYASKIRFNAAEPFAAAEVSLRVSNRVKSYAGVRMQDDYMQTFAVEREINKIVCDSVMNVIYGDTLMVPIAVMPAVASAGKTLRVQTSSSMILSVDEAAMVIDDEGMAYVTVVGELPGTAALTYTVDDSKLKATTIVNVVKRDAIVVATPQASIASGTVVERGTELILSCETEGATIYYSTDGSCPCDLETAKVYEAPIVIEHSVTIKAIAVKQDMYDSDIAEFVYTVDGDDGVESIRIDADIRLYPLPLRDRLTVTAGGKTINSVAVYTINGALALAVSKPGAEVQLDVQSLAAGIYIVHITTDDNACSRKVLKVE